MQKVPKGRLNVEEYVAGILKHDRIILSKAITLAESQLEADQILAQEVLTHILPFTGKSIRIGITGAPGVGKSTFIEAFGQYLMQLGKKLAILAIDPSSQLTKGSIMGDKTRMTTLAFHPNTYIRPSPSGKSLGGVAQYTREAILLCEAAGFDIIFIETVGVGQSEVMVYNMVDFFLLLLLAGGGDELQGIKKGIIEMVDGLVITKADGENMKAAQKAKSEYQSALQFFSKTKPNWQPEVLTCSALANEGLEPIWQLMLQFEEQMKQNNFWELQRKNQQVLWMHEIIKNHLEAQFYKKTLVKTLLPSLEQKVFEGETIATKAAWDILNVK